MVLKIDSKQVTDLINNLIELTVCVDNLYTANNKIYGESDINKLIEEVNNLTLDSLTQLTEENHTTITKGHFKYTEYNNKKIAGVP